MVKYSKSFLGDLSGKIGGYVFKTGKNGTYISSRPTPSKKPPTIKQQLQRNKMTTVIDFLRPLQSLLTEAYFPFQQNKSGFHAAKSYYLKESVTQEQNNFVINYSKAIVSFGDLCGVANAQCTPDATNLSVLVQWNNNSEQAIAYPTDNLLLVVYAPETKKTLYITGLAKRADAQAVWELGPDWANTECHLWAGFYQPEAQRASPSSYVGSFSI